jgi:hypothetical protein
MVPKKRSDRADGENGLMLLSQSEFRPGAPLPTGELMVFEAFVEEATQT